MTTVGFDVSALDESFKEHAQRGIGRYVRELRRHFLQSESSRVTIAEFDHRTFVPGGIFDRVPVGRETLKQQIIFPSKLWLSGGRTYDFFHFPAQMDAPSWCRVPYILTVLDLIPLVCADLYRADRPGWRFKLARWIEMKAIQNASLILAISENTARDVERIMGIPPERIRVTPLGVDESFFAATSPADPVALRQRYGVPQDRPVILYVGGIDQRKNCSSLIAVVKQLKERCLAAGKVPPVLLMVGRIQQDRQFPRLQQQILDAGLVQDVSMPGFVADEDLLHWYAVSEAFCFLSLYEGFGLPVLEAMAAGTPVVSSHASCMPEVMGDACIAVAPQDIAAASEALYAILTDPDLSRRLSEAGKVRARKFSWAETSRLTMAAYEEFAVTLAEGRRALHA